MLFLGRVGETEYDQVWAWEEAMHVSAMNGLIGIRIILGHYDAMAHKPKLTNVSHHLLGTTTCSPPFVEGYPGAFIAIAQRTDLWDLYKFV